MSSTVVRFRSTRAGSVVEKEPRQDLAPADVAEDNRLRQQELLTELGLLALKGTPFDELLQQTTRITAEGLGTEFCKILEFVPATGRLLVRAGVGWEPGVVGSSTVGADLESPAGYALQTGAPVLSNHLENEDRFRTPELLVEHGIHRALNVILQGAGTPYGVLEVDSRLEGQFNERDIVFLQGAANLLGMAIERQRIEQDLRGALDRQRTLLAEVNHPVNNSDQIVGSMLHLQSRTTTNPEVHHHLGEASGRIVAIARAHQRLYKTDEFSSINLGAYLEEVCSDFAQAVPGSVIHLEAPDHVVFSTDRAILVALMINEIITNAAKYAYPKGLCLVWVTLTRIDDGIEVAVRDEGSGLPPDFDPDKAKGLGMRLIRSFKDQLGGSLRFGRLDPGTEVVIRCPLA